MKAISNKLFCQFSVVCLALILFQSAMAEESDTPPKVEVTEGNGAAMESGGQSLLGASEEPIAIMDLRASPLLKKEVDALQEIIAVSVAKASGRRTISPRDVKDILTLEAQKQLIGCSEGGCLEGIENLGNALGANYLITGSLSKLGEEYSLALSLINMGERKAVNRIAIVAPDIADMGRRIPNGVGNLFQAPGYVSLLNQIEGAVVYINGKKTAVLPVEEIPIPAGDEIELRIEHTSYVPYTKSLSASPNQRLRMRLNMTGFSELERKAEARQWAGVSLAGAGGVSWIASAILFYSSVQAKKGYDSLDRRRDPPREFDDYKSKAQTNLAAGVATAVAGAAMAGVGIWLIVDNPHKKELELYDRGATAVTVLPTRSGAQLAVSGNF